jgi:hypothetical protein
MNALFKDKKEFRSQLLGFIVNKTEGGKELGMDGLRKVAAANEGVLFFPGHDLRSFIAGHILAADPGKYTISYDVRAGDHVFADDSYVPETIQYAAKPHDRGRSPHIRYEDEYAESLDSIFNHEMERARKRLEAKGIVAQGKAIGVLPMQEESEYGEGSDRYPFILEERQLRDADARKNALSALCIPPETPYVLVSQAIAYSTGFRYSYPYASFMETPAEKLKTRWSSGAAFAFEFDVYGVPWK